MTPSLALTLALTLTLILSRTLTRYAKNPDLYYATLGADPALLLPVGRRTRYTRTRHPPPTTHHPPPTTTLHPRTAAWSLCQAVTMPRTLQLASASCPTSSPNPNSSPSPSPSPIPSPNPNPLTRGQVAYTPTVGEACQKFGKTPLTEPEP